ncbi:hypothetical protein LVO79_21555 (plasmid) [Roseivivax marinus]|nr:hypothetical protein [Roseivivax marinus]UMA67437.1 hypothetical protein LVO79_21555 [Roseivivax marinus]
MYYLVETEYVGINCGEDRYVDTHRIEIRMSPACDFDGEVCVDESCGEIAGWATRGIGAYQKIENAREAIERIFGDTRQVSYAEYDPSVEAGQVIEAYKPGRFTPLTRQETEVWAWDGLDIDITEATTVEDIAVLVQEYESAANTNCGFTLHPDLEILMKERQQELGGDP